ncbi:MAG TPA: hypothetical protein VGM95_02455 [Lactobacillaceae bacterium]|jgi:uncharacterized membrane protein YczE
MYKLDGQLVELTWLQRFSFFFVSLVVNSFGNALSVASDLGSAPWTASAANLAHTFGGPISWYLMIYTVLIGLLNMVLLGVWNWRRFTGNLIFGLSFSYLVGFFAQFLSQTLQVSAAPVAARFVLDVLAIYLIGVSISVYQRVNWLLHPLDDLTNILRFKFFKGSATAGQMSNFVIALLISLTCYAFSGALVALGIGTLISFFLQGKNIGLSDRIIFPNLIHAPLTGEQRR